MRYKDLVKAATINIFILTRKFKKNPKKLLIRNDKCFCVDYYMYLNNPIQFVFV